MATVTVRITGIDKVQTNLTKLRSLLSDNTDIMTTLSSVLLPFFQDSVFISHGSVIGKSWAPLSPKTQREKDRKWPGRGILVRSGDMQHSFTSEIAPSRLFITNTSDHFIFHQDGTSEGLGRGHNIPARKMLAINSTVEGIIRETVSAGVSAKIEESRA